MSEVRELIETRLGDLKDSLERGLKSYVDSVMLSRFQASGVADKKGPDVGRVIAAIALSRAAMAVGMNPAEYWRSRLQMPETSFGEWVLSGEFNVRDVARRMFTQTTLTPELGGALVFPDVAALEVDAFLRPTAVVRRHVSNVVSGDAPFPIARISEGAVVRPIGEGRPAAKTGFKVELTTLVPKKLAGLVPLTMESVRAPRVGVLEMVRSDLQSALSAGEDNYLINGSGTEFEPRGLVKWVTLPDITANATITADNVVKDINKMIVAMKNANIPMRSPVFFMAPRTKNFLKTLTNGFVYPYREELSMNNTIEGIPVEETPQIPINLGPGSNESFILLADMSFAVIVDSGNVDIEVSREATFVDGSDVVSAFQSDLVLVRIISKVELGMRHPAAVVRMTGVKWGA
ncbi:MAG: hypothetical protein KatS3mg054_0109 [Chloroflexus sp.]|nr:MAG: hypothetical protein KatS3mg054_0109 [Chloroflexus sp.]